MGSYPGQWKMHYKNIKKYTILLIDRTTPVIGHTIDGNPITAAIKAKDIGLFVLNNLSTSRQCKKSVTFAMMKLWMLRW